MFLLTIYTHPSHTQYTDHMILKHNGAKTLESFPLLIDTSLFANNCNLREHYKRDFYTVIQPSLPVLFIDSKSSPASFFDRCFIIDIMIREFGDYIIEKESKFVSSITISTRVFVCLCIMYSLAEFQRILVYDYE